MASKLSLKFNRNNFTDFLTKLQDLTNIADVIKLKIDKDQILMYSMLSNDVAVLALKSYLVSTTDYIENFDQEEIFDFVITSATKFVKNLMFFNSDSPIKMDIIFKPLPDDEMTMHIRSAQISSGKLKISCIGGEEFKVRDIGKTQLEARLNPKNCKWDFKVSQSDFADVRKLCNINKESVILNINVIDGVVTMNETSKWELEIDTIPSRNTNIVFGKKYLSNINTENKIIQFYVFETFILVKDNNSNLMLSFEQTFEENME
jgi:hypothetical protein